MRVLLDTCVLSEIRTAEGNRGVRQAVDGTQHQQDVAGHDHWAAGVAIGVAIGLSVWGALKGRDKDEAAQEADAETGEELQEA